MPELEPLEQMAGAFGRRLTASHQKGKGTRTRASLAPWGIGAVGSASAAAWRSLHRRLQRRFTSDPEQRIDPKVLVILLGFGESGAGDQAIE